MLLTVSTTYRPATDLGFLSHKHPDRSQSFPVAGGTAQVFPVAIVLDLPERVCLERDAARTATSTAVVPSSRTC